jgi:hypothetical protein
MEIRNRITSLSEESERQWGKMTVSQMLAHCVASMDLSPGSESPPRSLGGRVVGRIAKRFVIGDAPIARNMPTDPRLIMTGDRDFAAEQHRLLEAVDRFSAGGPAQFTTYPHTFFGPLTPAEWAIMHYKHLDHHLTQFGA